MATVDPLVINLNNISPTRGEGPMDIARRIAGGRALRRNYGETESRQEKGPGAELILCPGAAVGKCTDGLTRHFRPYHAPQQFLGFHEATVDAHHVIVRSRGLARLKVRGVEGAGAKVGTPVFVSDVDDFSINPTTEHAVLMGEIKAVEAHTGFALVSFRAYNDVRPFRADSDLQEIERR